MNKLPTLTPTDIDAARVKLGKKQREMAQMLGVDLRTYQRWEYGERPISGPAVLLLQRILADHENLNRKSG
jgi:DNA-binding transcriptional regulator YiaG